jgi:hypothetical protein
VRNRSKLGTGPGGDLATVELEDDAIVASVAHGARSSLAKAGRYAPAHEAGVHHFHRMFLAALSA